MPLIPPSVDRLTREFAKFPGIGAKTAQRLAFYCLKDIDTLPGELAEALLQVKEAIGHCRVCGFVAEGEKCEICSNPGRDHHILCVVEHPLDVLAIERSGEFHGVYHVLWGALSPIDGIGPEQLGLDQLEKRVDDEGITEVMLATDPDVEGETTAQFIAEVLATRPAVRVSRLAYGLPVGADVEYADAVTVARAIAGRRDLSQ